MSNLLLASAVGIGGTVFMDLWSVLLNRVIAIAPPQLGVGWQMDVPLKIRSGFPLRHSNRGRNGC